MKLRFVAETAALVSAYSAHVVEAQSQVPNEFLQPYWQRSRERLHRWMKCLNERLNVDGEGIASEPGRSWHQIEAVIEEVLVSEILTRVWAAVLTAADRRRGTCHGEPVARSSLIGHIEARHLALNVIVKESHASFSELARLDRLRRSSERWTDLLLGHLVKQHGVGEFAFDERRAVDFANDQMGGGSAGTPSPVWRFVLASLRIAFPETLCQRPPNGDLTHEIVRSVIASLPADAFQPHGPLKSVLLTRINRSGLHPDRAPETHVEQPDTSYAFRRMATLRSPETTAISFARLRRHSERELP